MVKECKIYRKNIFNRGRNAIYCKICTEKLENKKRRIRTDIVKILYHLKKKYNTNNLKKIYKEVKKENDKKSK